MSWTKLVAICVMEFNIQIRGNKQSLPKYVGIQANKLTALIHKEWCCQDMTLREGELCAASSNYHNSIGLIFMSGNYEHRNETEYNIVQNVLQLLKNCLHRIMLVCRAVQSSQEVKRTY